VRVIAATNKDLVKEVERGRFREDLFYRLNVVPIFMPPLRERRADVPELARHFLTEFCIANGREQIRFTDKALDLLSAWEFPGNIRELKNLVERLAIFAVGPTIDAQDVQAATMPLRGSESPHFFRSRPLADAKTELERVYIETQLRLHNWDIATTAKALDILANNLHRKITQLGIERPGRKLPDRPEGA